MLSRASSKTIDLHVRNADGLADALSPTACRQLSAVAAALTASFSRRKADLHVRLMRPASLTRSASSIQRWLCAGAAIAVLTAGVSSGTADLHVRDASGLADALSQQHDLLLRRGVLLYGLPSQRLYLLKQLDLVPARIQS